MPGVRCLRWSVDTVMAVATVIVLLQSFVVAQTENNSVPSPLSTSSTSLVSSTSLSETQLLSQTISIVSTPAPALSSLAQSSTADGSFTTPISSVNSASVRFVAGSGSHAPAVATPVHVVPVPGHVIPHMSGPGPQRQHNSHSPKAIDIFFEVAGAIIGVICTIGIFRCLYSWRKTPSRNRLQDVVHRHNIERELEEQRQSTLLPQRRWKAPPPPYIPPPVYDELPVSSPPHTPPLDLSHVPLSSPSPAFILLPPTALAPTPPAPVHSNDSR